MLKKTLSVVNLSKKLRNLPLVRFYGSGHDHHPTTHHNPDECDADGEPYTDDDGRLFRRPVKKIY